MPLELQKVDKYSHTHEKNRKFLDFQEVCPPGTKMWNPDKLFERFEALKRFETVEKFEKYTILHLAWEYREARRWRIPFEEDNGGSSSRSNYSQNRLRSRARK